MDIVRNRNNIKLLGVGIIFFMFSWLILFVDFRYVNSIEYLDSDFFTFWLAGRMNWTGENPYSSFQWIESHHIQGATWIPNPSFPYPLPLAYFLAPLGLMEVKEAYIIWIYLSQTAVIVSVLLVMSLYIQLEQHYYLFPILAGVILFRPTIVTFWNGQLGAWILLIASISMWLLEKNRFFIGGIVLALMLLKPSFGVPILGLVSVWGIAHKHWRIIVGIGLGALMLFIMGLIRDKDWIVEFMRSGSSKVLNNFGYSPTFWGVSSIICKYQISCTLPLGLFLSLSMTVFVGWLLTRVLSPKTPALAFSLVIPAALLITPYIWAYDQILLVPPIIVIMLSRAKAGASCLSSSIIFLLYSILSLVLLAMAAQFGHDSWSALVPLLCVAPLISYIWKYPS